MPISVIRFPSLARIIMLLALAASGCGTASVSGGSAQGVTVDVIPRVVQTAPGGLVGYRAEVTGTVNTAVAWTVQEAGGGTIDAGGAYTAPVSLGTFHVVATSQADTTRSAVATVTVTTAPVIAVIVTPASATTTVGSQVAFSAQVTGTTGTQPTASTWAVLESGGGTIDAAGVYTAPSTTGTYHVIARSVADTTKTAEATVVVNPRPAGAGAVAMALISRRVPATSSSGSAEQAQDDSYGGPEWGFHMADIGSGWVAYDLSGVPAAQRQKLLVALYLGKGDQYYQLNYRNASWTPEFTPDAYVLEGATSAAGPWTVLASVSTNNNQFKSHFIGDFGPYTFIRFRVTSTANGCRVKMDVYDAGTGIGDGLVFYGDSITTNIFSGGYAGYGPEWFSRPVQASAPGFFPFVIGGGYPFVTSADGRDLIVNGTGDFASGLAAPLATIFRDARYAALLFGANDAPAQSLVDAFRANYRQIVDRLRANGQTVIVASPTWATDAARQAGLVQIRAAIGFHLPSWSAGTVARGTYVWNAARAYLCTTAGTSVAGPTGTGTGLSDGGTARWSYVPSLREDYAGDPGVLGGPDLYSLFLNHSEWLFDGLHPNDTGETQWRNAWVTWALANVYR